MNVFVRALPVVAALALSGCGWLYGKNGLIRDTEHDYLEARQTAPLQMPANLTGFQAKDQYPVPELGAKGATGPMGDALDVNPPALVLSSGDGVNGIQDAAVPQALIVGDNSLLWQRLNAFLDSNQIPVESRDEATGEILTGWVQTEEIGWFRDWVMGETIESYRWQYRFKVQPGERPNERLVIAEAVRAEAYDEDSDWQPQTPTRRNSVDMLNQFLGYYDDAQSQAARERVLAARAGITVELWQNDAGQTGLLAQSPLDNTWDATPAVLGRLGFVQEDKDTTKHLYYFKLEESDEGGFWDWLFGDDRDDQVRLELEQGEYLVQLSPVGDRTGLLFSKADGDVLDAATLTKLFPVLSDAFAERRQHVLLDAPRR
ncbi:outer membrane protein assembly factor BamC [Permianibacter sp. IMCC34836]|uniref:outer membrane protein assembly factor BamC n=1 Tax=Permianibacter fluminis TaxID=2738515 RepID=UPI001553265C|nr:outer membrane protein assembly factor BamC [Permianibacter fluminis]NQD38324.1 outer membrane protein assembly factor BamC [Permianibacter fluminis]